MIKQKTNLKGFSLIETLVSVSLFTFVCLLAISTLISTYKINTRLKATRNVYDNLNLVLEDLLRESKQGSNYYCLFAADVSGGQAGVAINYSSVRDCAYGANGIGLVIQPQGYDLTKRVAYFYNSVTKQIVKETFNINASTFLMDTNTISMQNMTTDNIIIENFNFTIAGTSKYATGNLKQPMIKLIVGGKTKTNPVVSFTVESAASQRTLDF
jgi:type II secretory pathway pseudopilin PulG